MKTQKTETLLLGPALSLHRAPLGNSAEVGQAQSEGHVLLAWAGHRSASSLQLPCSFVQGLLLRLDEWLDRGPAARALDWDSGDESDTNSE